MLLHPTDMLQKPTQRLWPLRSALVLVFADIMGTNPRSKASHLVKVDLARIAESHILRLFLGAVVSNVPTAGATKEQKQFSMHTDRRITEEYIGRR